VSEIASASQEQTSAIDQVNDALGQIDQVTQGNTSNAEESASAAEELSSQAGHLKQMLGKFRLDKKAGGLDSRAAKKPSKKKAIASAPVAETAHAHAGGNGGSKQHEVEPDDVISLDDADFGEF
ncbi:hypothetical protein GF324_08825, partial [bacterium]|nr:hypothetical protein [bacterium]